ncbi:MAG: hypothetical protein GY754_17845 [bacterium]|nr:hypothetical protein [bacterium]
MNEKLNVYLEKNNKLKDRRKQRNEELIKSIGDMLINVMTLKEVINDYKKMRNANFSKIEYGLGIVDGSLRKLEDLYMYLEFCNFEITKSEKLLSNAKNIYFLKYGNHYQSDFARGVEGDIFELFKRHYGKISFKVELHSVKKWIGIDYFYSSCFLDPTFMVGESYGINENENILSYFISNHPPVVYSVATDKNFFLSYYSKDDSYYRTYYLPYELYKAFSMRLGNRAPFFVTDILTGCGFQVFGSNILPYVSHVNAGKIGNNEETHLGKYREKARAMGIVFGKILETNRESLQTTIGANGIVRVIYDVEKAGNDFLNWDESVYNSENEGITGKIYTLYYGLKCAIVGKIINNQWYFYVLFRKPTGDEENPFALEEHQIWPVPEEVKTRLNRNSDEEIQPSESEN